ncbi:MAG TPA: tRNA (N6-isopentenyl adenosine(37)-C2)-methylthiotransferase MiaB [Candidatus Omnitrophota bacterium]|nr:tRNA (N6-isopentenyl adenosine(37)-C2)-methylthiotransferase MiaB [Candidatus Omnitrophota bacterium]HRZ15824.1 tRNA (N6-isopentenyl adenosine(37)-C2)-methylthiotransferase MiaB [Candidatus Omnitrophota bacterium]
MNVRDSEVIAGLLKQAGYALTESAEHADAVIFNTCSVRQHAEDKVWSEIGRLTKSSRAQRKSAAGKKPKQKPLVGLVGCMAQNYKEAVFERSPAVDFVVGPADIAKIPAILERLFSARKQSGGSSLYEVKVWETDAESRPEEIYHTGYRQDPEQAYVVISEGCSNMCAYCVVPFVRGALRNRPYKEIVREIKEAAAGGRRKITLLGQNVNAYRGDEGDFVALLRTVAQLKGVDELSFITSHPRDTTVEIFRVMAEYANIKPYLHLPFQAGSNAVLKRMNRGYTREYYLDLARQYRKLVPGGALSTDIIVGFPGETQEDFQQTVDLVRDVEFESAYIFKYSPRPHSEAYAWADTVEQAEKERRHALILDLQKTISRRKK